MTTVTTSTETTFITKGGADSPLKLLELNRVFKFLTGAKGPSGFGSASTTEDVTAKWDGRGKVVLVTGANTGQGFETARVMALRGAQVVVTARDEKKAADAVSELTRVLGRRVPGGTDAVGKLLTPMKLDLASQQSVREFATKFLATGRPLHILMNNGGEMGTPFKLSPEGHELQIATNLYGHFMLTMLLLDRMIETARTSGVQGRIVNTASLGHFLTPNNSGILPEDQIDKRENYNPWTAYGQSKLGNILFTRSLNERLRAKGVNIATVTVNPGPISTNLDRHIGYVGGGVNLGSVGGSILGVLSRPILKGIPNGAATQVYCATAPSIEGGEYYEECNLSFSSHFSHDRKMAERLWGICVRNTGVDAKL